LVVGLGLGVVDEILALGFAGGGSGVLGELLVDLLGLFVRRVGL